MTRSVRSTGGCVVCKARKVKCDQQDGSCGNCRRLCIDCPGYSLPPQEDRRVVVEQALHAAGHRKRGLGSCIECRSVKIRCSRHKPRCERCQRRGLGCTYRSQRRIAQADSAATNPVVQTPASQSPSSHGNDSPPFLESSAVATAIDEVHLSVERMHCRPLSPTPSGLPSLAVVKELTLIYFSRVHPLRCLGFLHKPSFMQSLQEGDVTEKYTEALLLTICAFGARYKFHSAVTSHMDYAIMDTDEIPGNIWLRRASDLVFRQIGQPSIHNLMTLILLCEYNLRWGSQSTAIMIATCCSQMSRLLRLDSRVTYEPLANDHMFKHQLDRQTRIRLFWSCYILDMLMASGVESLTNTKMIPTVPLPCCGQDFTLGTTYDYRLLTSQECDFPDNQAGRIGVEECFLRLIYLRSYILRLIRKTNFSTNLWSEQSEFYHPIRGLQQWIATLPEHLKFSQLNSYIQRDQQQLSAFYAIHLLYHQTFCDLYRVVLPGYRFPIKEALKDAPRAFILECQHECLEHAEAISSILKSTIQHGPEALDDPISGVCLYESTKIQVIIGRSCSAGLPIEDWDRILGNVVTNLKGVDQCCTHLGWGILLMTALCNLLDQFNLSEMTAPWKQKYGSSNELSDVFPTADNHHLHPLSSYQVAWKEIRRSEANRAQNQGAQDLSVGGEASSGFTPGTYRADTEQTTDFQFDAPLAQVYYTQVATDLQDYISWNPFSLSTDDPDLYMGL